MPSSSTEPAAFLRELLLRLVEVLRAEGGPSWELMVRVSRGRSAVVEVDGHRLELRASRALPFRLRIAISTTAKPPLFLAKGLVFLSILEGQTTLESALVDGTIEVRAALADLLGIHSLVMSILADSPRSAPLRALWREWRRGWPHLPPAAAPLPLDGQHALHGQLVAAISADLRSPNH